jgi:hypothetical protein
MTVETRHISLIKWCVQQVLSDARTAQIPLPVVVDQAHGAPFEAIGLDNSSTADGAGVYLADDSDHLLVWCDLESLERRPIALAAVADVIQDWILEELPSRQLPAVWPACPAHPQHPLVAQVIGETAMWVCPETREGKATIGAL